MERHAFRADGIDMTLCGLSMDGDDGEKSCDLPVCAVKGEQVDCKDCQRVISHCQSRFTASWRVR